MPGLLIDAGSAGGDGGSSRPARAAAVTCLLGLLLTAVSAWASYEVDRSTEERLVRTQTEQAATVLSTAIFLIQQPLTTALQVQAAAGADGDPSVFRRTFAVNVGKQGTFVTASLWQRDGRGFTRLAAVGATPGIGPRSPTMGDFLDRAVDSKTSVVARVQVGDRSRIAYALADMATGFVVYVERALPADRRAPVDDDDSAFTSLHYAIYLGEQTRLEDLTTTDIDPADLPLEGRTHTTTVPFGDTVLTLVTQPTEHLGSTLSHRLPLILLLAGLLLSVATAFVARQLVAAQLRVEMGSTTINDLYEQINTNFEEQREVFVRLQRALLPHVIPQIPQLEVASRYVAGAEGVEIGGDWYSLIDVDEDRFAFVVGDVSGKGVDAVAEMARARFTLRAYLADGNDPATALEKCSHQFDVARDGHIITAVVGVGTWRTGEVVAVSAGHPLPLLVTDEGASHVAMAVGPPLGVGLSSYEQARFTLAPGSTLLAYTDGLVERRGEDIDTGLRRLVEAVDLHREAPVSDLLTSLLDTLRGEGAPDDIALLAMRREAVREVEDEGVRAADPQWSAAP